LLSDLVRLVCNLLGLLSAATWRLRVVWPSHATRSSNSRFIASCNVIIALKGSPRSIVLVILLS